MAETPTPSGDKLRVLHAAQDMLSQAGARRGRDDTHMDSFASASAGLMQLSSAAERADSSSSVSASISEPDEPARGAEPPLPPGWNPIVHASGLRCYANYRLGVVCWAKPYALGADAAQLTEPDFTRLVKRHVPPAGIFQPERAAGAMDPAAASPSRANPPIARPGGAGEAEPPSTTVPAVTPTQSSEEPRKRKADAADRAAGPHSSRASDKFSLMSMDEFERLAIDDPRVLQACMELAVKTPAQVLQEYQNRNRGVSINYNTVPSEVDGVKLFKTIVTAGSTVAEGIASTKKIAKQLGAQQLLALLHERTARTYMQVAELYSSSVKAQPVTTESSMSAAAPAPSASASLVSGQTISNSLRSVGTPGRIVDARFARASSGASSSNGSIPGLGAAPGGSGSASAGIDGRHRKFQRASPSREYGRYDEGYADVAGYGATNQWEGYHQESTPSWPREEMHADSPGPERIVVYSSPSSANNSSNYGRPYYPGGHPPWTFAPPRGLPLPPPPQHPSLSASLPTNGGYASRYAGDQDRGAAVSSRQYGYGGAYRSRSSDRGASTKQSQARYRPHPSE